MKSLISIILVTFTGLSFAQDFSVNEAVLTYDCTFRGKEFSGKAKLTKELLEVYSNPIIIDRNTVITFNLKRMHKINDIYLELKDIKDRNDPNQWIFLAGVLTKDLSFKNTQVIQTIKYGFANQKKADLDCIVNTLVD